MVITYITAKITYNYFFAINDNVVVDNNSVVVVLGESHYK